MRYYKESMDTVSNHHQEERPWGGFEQFTLNEPCTVKILHVDADKRFSLQKHAHRTEFWKVLDGDGVLQIGDEIRTIIRGDMVTVPQGTLHRLTGGVQGLRVLEIAYGEFDENDIERVEDDFGRTMP